MNSDEPERTAGFLFRRADAQQQLIALRETAAHRAQLA